METKIYMAIIIFLLVGAFFIIGQENVSLRQEGEFSKFIGLYISWISQLFENAKTATGYLIKMDWLPDKGEG